MQVVKALLEGLIDYAGLFPPAGLSMETSVRNYARYLASDDRFALGRFIVPVSRLEELAREQARVPHPDEWHLSALAGTDAAADFARVERFNRTHAGRAVVDAVELKVTTSDDVARVGSRDRSIDVYVEIPASGEPHELLASIAAAGLRAKIRTGGVTPDAFPPAAHVVRFISGCRQLELPFKATAGLHHPLRCVRPLTYERGSETGAMHGFMNVFLAAALIDHGEEARHVEELLDESDSATFRIEDDVIHWRELSLTTDQMAVTRNRFATSFGSCSFEEPISDLRELGWLAARR